MAEGGNFQTEDVDLDRHLTLHEPFDNSEVESQLAETQQGKSFSK